MMYLLLSLAAVLMTVSNCQLIPDCQSFRVGEPGDYSVYPIGGIFIHTLYVPFHVITTFESISDHNNPS